MSNHATKTRRRIQENQARISGALRRNEEHELVQLVGHARYTSKRKDLLLIGLVHLNTNTVCEHKGNQHVQLERLTILTHATKVGCRRLSNFAPAEHVNNHSLGQFKATLVIKIHMHLMNVAQMLSNLGGKDNP